MKIGTSWDDLGQVGTSWEQLGQVGTSWDELGRVGNQRNYRNLTLKKPSGERRKKERKKKNIGYRVASNKRRLKRCNISKSHVCLKCLNIKDFFSAHVSSPLGQDVFFEEKTIMFAISLGILFIFRVCDDKKNSIATEIHIF